MNFAFEDYDNLNDRYLVKKIEDLHSDQLRQLYLTVGVSEKFSFRSKMEAIEGFLELEIPYKDKCKAVYDLELISPTTHGFLLKLNLESFNITEFSVKRSNTIFREKALGFKKIKLVHTRIYSDEVKLLFEHPYSFCREKQLEGNKFERGEIERIHSIVVTINTKNKWVYISYNGFTQGQGLDSKKRINYRELVGFVNKVLVNEFKLELQTIFLKNGLGKVLDLKANSIHIVKASPTQDKGKMTLISNLGDKSVQSWLAALIQKRIPEVTLEQLENAIYKALKEDCRNDSYVVNWKFQSFNIQIRIDFWEKGPEFLFIWGNGQKSIDLISEFCNQMSALGEITSHESLNEVWDFIINSNSGTIFITSEIVNKYKINFENYKELIREAISLGFLETVFKIDIGQSTTAELNDWNSDLNKVMKKINTSLGVVDGASHENISIAFRRCPWTK